MGDRHSLNSLRMGLNLTDLIEGVLDKVDSSRLSILSNTSEHSSASLRSNELSVLNILLVTNKLLASVTKVACVT